MTGLDNTVHIMLLFLSDTKYKSSENTIESFEYEGIHGKVQLTNEAAVRYLMQNGYKGKPVTLSKIYLFASQKVNGNIVDVIRRKNKETGKTIKEEKIYYRDDGTPWKHLAYFQHRISDMFPQLQNEHSTFITKIDYNESLPAKMSMQSVVDMAGQIQRDMNDRWKGKQIILHADCTGGLRHANMMMLSVLRLMQYSGIEIGKIMYANFSSDPKRVEEANLIYDTFGLVAGAEEFSNYGSVQAIKKFYDNENNESLELKTLLQAMEQFDDAVKLCHYGYFKQAIQQLRTAINNYPVLDTAQKETADEWEQVIHYNTSLAATLLPRIRTDYSELLSSEEPDDLTLIDWCLNHGYLQQALTLYTERIPEVLLDPDRHLLRFNPAFRDDLDLLIVRDSMGRSENFLIISEFKPNYEKKLFPNINTAAKAFKTLLKDDIRGFLAKEFDLQKVLADIQHFVEKYPNFEMTDEAFLRNLLLRLNDWKENPALLKGEVRDEVLQELVQRISQSIEDSAKASADWRKKAEKLCYTIQHSPHGKKKLEDISKFFTSQLDHKHLGELICDLDTIYAKEALDLVQSRCIESDLDDDVVLRILTDYYEIKDERNHTNHARLETDDIKSAEELKQFMKVRLQRIKNRCH